MRRGIAALVVGLMVTQSCGDDTGPTPGPMRLKNVLVFTSDRSGGLQLHRMHPDGTGITLIPTSAPGYASAPAVSPDGRQIAFGVNGDIHVVEADGSRDVNLTQTPSIDEGQPAWSPDGSQLAFDAVSTGITDLDVFVMQSDGSGRRNVTADPADDRAPNWSPDGSRLAFMSNRGGGPYHIWTIGVAGGAATALTNGVANDDGPWWSPDGTRIVFGSTRGLNNGLYVMNADGSNVQPLPAPGMNTGFGRWSPDGRSIVFECGASDLHVCRIAPDGTGLVDLTPGSGTRNQFPTWSP